MARRVQAADPVWQGAEELRGQLVPISGLTLDPRNARRHPEPNLAAIQRSLSKWGQLKSVVVRDGTVVAGNGLVQCAESLGWSHVAAVEFGHGEADARSFGLLDNRSAELAEWDRDVLAGLLQEIQGNGLDLLDAGFSEADYAEIMAATVVPDFQPVSADEQGRLDQKKSITCPECGHEFTT